MVAPTVRCRMSTLPLLGNPANRGRDWFAAFGGRVPARHVAVFDHTETGSRLLPLSRKRLKAGFAHYLVGMGTACFPEVQLPQEQALAGPIGIDTE